MLLFVIDLLFLLYYPRHRARGGSRPMQPMRMHRSEFHVNLIPPNQVSIKTPKNNNIHILISKRVRVGPIVVFQSIILSIKTMISNEENFDSHFACFLFIVFLSIYIYI